MAPSLEGTDRLRIVDCRSRDEYEHVCRSSLLGSGDIPIFQRAGRHWPILRLAGGAVATSFRDYLERAAPSPISSHGTKVRDSVSINDEQERPTVVLASDDAWTRSAASFLADSLGAQFFVVPASALSERASQLARRSATVVVLPLSEATDAVIQTLLGEFETALETKLQWDQLPRVSLITGRDSAALTWSVAKILIAQRSVTDHCEARFSYINGFQQEGVITELRSISGELSFDRRMASSIEIVDALLRDSTVIAHAGHGRDACAGAGSGVWLCGRNSPISASPQSGKSILACGVGHPCLYGPQPVRLSEVPAEIMMVSACNSLRLADSSLTSDFNLGLEFLEGVGRAYVGATRFQTPGVVVQAFLASLASGLSLSEATNIVNGFVAQSGIDRPAFFAMGYPDDKVGSRNSNREALQEQCPRDAEIGQDLTLRPNSVPTHLFSACLRGSKLLTAARDGTLSFAISPEHEGESVSWFCRIESSSAASPSPSDVLRVFFFRFPEPLEALRVRPYRRDELALEYAESLKILARWNEVLERIGDDNRVATLADHVSDVHRRGQEFATRGEFLQKYDGGSFAAWNAQLHSHRDTAHQAGFTALKSLSPLLTQGWYLSNTLGEAYPFTEGSNASCPYCRGSSICWIGRNPIHGERRRLDICSRCGTVRDLAELGSIADVQIDAADELFAGDELVGCVRIVMKDRARSPSRIYVATRLDTPGLPGVSPWKETRVCEPDGPLDAPFSMCVPIAIHSRQCDLKVLVTSEDSIAFAHRIVSVRARQDRSAIQGSALPE